MVTDEMVEKACLAYWGDKNMTSMFKGKTREGVESSMRAAIEAALSTDAEPVAWQPRYKQEVIDHLRTVSDDVSEYAMTVFPTKEQAEEYGHGGHDVRPLYAEPVKTAPAGAVKALEWRDEPVPPSGETLAPSVVGLYCIPHSGDRFYLRFRDAITLGDYSTLDKAKAAAQADYEARILSALSAQVQDVAGIRAQAIEDVLSALTAHELYQYRPKAFRGFIDYARSTLINDEDGKLWRATASPASKHGDAE